MSSTPVEIGTLIAVILKAKNLPNKRHIGKQDPYCAVSLNGEKRRTKAIKRGGQHPEWDEEVRFTLFEDTEDELARTATGDDTPPPPPPKNGKGAKGLRKIKGGKVMKVSCFADDPREPDLIGETMVDLTEVLTKGETDEWFTLMNKDKYCGEVYLELTFWSNEAPPEKKAPPKSSKNNKQYGGAGSFVPLDDVPPSLMTGHGSRHSISRIPSASGSAYDDRPDAIPSSLRSSNSLAKLDLYVAPYEQNRVDAITSDFGELSVSGHQRRESVPTRPSGGYAQRPVSVASTLSSHPSQGSFSETTSAFSYDRPVTPTAPLPHRSSISGSYYQPQYESTPSSSGFAPPQPTVRRPRYSVPAASSGFMPIPSPAPSGFTQLQTHTSEPSGYLPTVSHMTGSPGYGVPPPSQGYGTPPALTPAHSGFMPPIPPSSSAGFHPQQSYPPQPAQPYEYNYDYAQYGPPTPAASAPPGQYLPPQPPPSVPPQSHSAPPDQYQGYDTSTPPQQYLPPQPSGPVTTPTYQGYPGSSPQPQYTGYSPTTPPQQYAPPSHGPVSTPPQSYQGYGSSTPSPPQDRTSPLPPPPPLSHSSSSLSSGRPLPQPGGQGQQSYPGPPPLPPGNSQYSPTNGIPFPTANPYASIPPPPPPPSHSYRRDSSPRPYPGENHQMHGSNPLPPPPPPPSQFQSNSPSGRPSLPQPPTSNYHPQQQPVYQPPPPPPPQHQLPPSQPNYGEQAQPYYPGPPPRPPVQRVSGSWGPPQPHDGYAQPAAQGAWN
ncbi:hypothetical protein PLICRDRAFT_170031 [Plicaturopsis crispa FD-325 SS-3]|nr:hypothetical protein PLICRDRAFT_170031 [Plicaturopsis crispa FD-325 SS-3]